MNQIVVTHRYQLHKNTPDSDLCIIPRQKCRKTNACELQDGSSGYHSNDTIEVARPIFGGNIQAVTRGRNLTVL